MAHPSGRKRPPDRTSRRPGPAPKRSELLDGIEDAETRALCLGSRLDIPGEHRLQFLAIAQAGRDAEPGEPGRAAAVTQPNAQPAIVVALTRAGRLTRRRADPDGPLREGRPFSLARTLSHLRLAEGTQRQDTCGWTVRAAALAAEVGIKREGLRQGAL